MREIKSRPGGEVTADGRQACLAQERPTARAGRARHLRSNLNISQSQLAKWISVNCARCKTGSSNTQLTGPARALLKIVASDLSVHWGVAWVKLNCRLVRRSVIM